MRKILLLEPYEQLANVITQLLRELNCDVDVVISGDITDAELTMRRYDCVFINLDQNRLPSEDGGLRLAEIASDAGVPVVMIPDHLIAAQKIAANGWLQLKKPFNLGNLEAVISKAMETDRVLHPVEDTFISERRRG